MLDLDLSHISSHFDLLQQNPSLSNLLLTDCDYDLDEVSAIIEPVLTAPQRCQKTEFYIQAVTTGYTAFLATNLIEEQIIPLTPVSASWLIGRSTVCTIQMPDRSVSRRHAVISHCPSGFYITDLGSLNGTWVNQHRLAPAERVDLEDGDLIQFGAIQVEFFLSKRVAIPVYSEETTHY